MAITSIVRDHGDNPDIVRIQSSDSLATIGGTGYLAAQAANIYSINKGPFNWVLSDFVLVYSSADADCGQFTISSDFKSLIPYVNPGDVTLPVVDGDVAIFDGTTGRIKDSSINKIQVPVSNGTGAFTVGNLFYPISGLIVRTIHVTVAQLNAGSIVVLDSAGVRSFQFLNLSISIGTNFDNGGNKEVLLTCDTDTFTTIPSATLKAQQNDFWCTTNLNAPTAPTGIASATAPGIPVLLQYGSGTINYSTGDFYLTVTAIQVA